MATKKPVNKQSKALQEYIKLHIELERRYDAREITAAEFFDADMKALHDSRHEFTKDEVVSVCDHLDKLHTAFSRDAAEKGFPVPRNNPQTKLNRLAY